VLKAAARFRASIGALSLWAAGCFGSAPRPDPGANTAPPVAIDLLTTAQRIDGFGAASAWTASNMSDAFADQLFSPTTGIGLSLLRLRIAPDGTTGEMATAQKAAARGAKIWASPWSPPAEWKDSTSPNNGGGHLLAADAQAWADRLASFAKSMSDAGLPLVGLSSQNEPDFGPTGYESCQWAPTDLVAFVRDNLGPALRSQGLSTPIVSPETGNWNSFDGYATALAADPYAMQYVGPLATHDYGGAAHVVPGLTSNQTVWETEYSDQSKTLDPGMGSGITVAKNIHENLVEGQVNAWHNWWINPGAMPMDNGALTQNGVLTRRAYVIGNWSRFVRPGFLRVSATEAPQDYVLVSAFRSPGGDTVVIVAINSAGYPLGQTFTVAGAALGQVTPWLTSDTVALAAQPVVSLTDGSFSYTLPAESVVSFVGTVAAAAP
jgi:glucuronoarabinoxylan endo-1,4-beta-xylanase